FPPPRAHRSRCTTRPAISTRSWPHSAACASCWVRTMGLLSFLSGKKDKAPAVAPEPATVAEQAPVAPPRESDHHSDTPFTPPGDEDRTSEAAQLQLGFL